MCQAVHRIADNDNTPDEQSFPVFDGVDDYNFYVYPPLKTPRLLPNVLRVYSHLLAFDPVNKRFNLVPCDPDGRLRVTTGQAGGISVNRTEVWVSNGRTTLLNTNPLRVKATFFNRGGEIAYIGNGFLFPFEWGFPLYPGATYTETLLTEGISAMTQSSYTMVQVQEYSTYPG